MTTYILYDDGGEFDRVDADNAKQAVRAYWETVTPNTYDIKYSDQYPYITPVCARSADDPDDEYEETMCLQQPEPDCSEIGGHDWQQPYELLGGLKENPGVFGHGGGTRGTEICAHCGTYRDWDTWYQDPTNGSIIDDTVTTYRDPDNESLRWVDSQAD